MYIAIHKSFLQQCLSEISTVQWDLTCKKYYYLVIYCWHGLPYFRPFWTLILSVIIPFNWTLVIISTIKSVTLSLTTLPLRNNHKPSLNQWKKRILGILFPGWPNNKDYICTTGLSKATLILLTHLQLSSVICPVTPLAQLFPTTVWSETLMVENLANCLLNHLWQNKI